MGVGSEPPSADNGPGTGLETTATYNGETFHLFQVVEIRPRPLPGDWPRQWMVVRLEEGVTVATIGFDETRKYHPNGDEFDGLTPVTENDTPVYGY